jgi:hypothetical protein
MICAGFTDWLGVAASSQKMSSSCFTDSTQRDFQSRSNPRKICYSPRMDIDLTGFSAVQQPALFDLLILFMYADGHLTTFEDEQLQKLLATMGFVDEIDRQREFDAAVTRIRPNIQSIHKAKELALDLADAFKDRNQQKQVLAAVEQMLTSDNNVSTWENTLLMELRMKFRL